MFVGHLDSESGVHQRSFSANKFCAALIAHLAIEDKQRLPIGNPLVEKAFRQIVDQLHAAAVGAYRSGDEDLAHEILDVLDGLRPNPNTGAFDEFWASLRRQQPGRVGVPNPRYKFFQIRLTKAQAKSEVNRVPNRWQQLILDSARSLARSI